MINHARTLLLNLPAEESGLPGEYYIPPGFQSMVLPQALITARCVLFGTRPDRVMQLYRSCQLMSCLHATDLREFVIRLDPRVTYWPQDPKAYWPLEFFDPQISQRSGPDCPWTMSGQPSAPDLSGVCQLRFAVDLTDSQHFRIRRQRPNPNQKIVEYNGSALALSGTGRKFQPKFASAGCSWVYEECLRPQWSLSMLSSQLSTMGEEVLTGLLGRETSEPWSTFRELWYSHPDVQYQLGGLALALIYRTEGLRSGL